MLSYSGPPVYVPNCVLVGDGCAMGEDYRSSAGFVVGHVKGIVGE